MIDTTNLTLRNLINFFNKIKQTQSCWIWTAYKDKDGYGKLTVYSKDRKGPYQLSAHRISYEIFKGEIPKGLQIDHLCRNRACVNPEHLDTVTIKENLYRGFGNAAINKQKTHCNKGHPFNKKNIYYDKNNGRYCRICNNARQKQYIRKKVLGLDR